MKNLFYLFIILVFISCRSGNKNIKEEKTGAQPEQVVETTIHIGGMHCDMCVTSVTKGVNELEGIESVVVSMNDSTAVVSFNANEIELAQIEKAIELRGYTIKPGM
ncbi:MAG: Cu2+-exporting [Prolixibacteraceae bacterium]|nr:MAG: Cu2+-exporting [Prolixibacteraceae bacterium]